MTMSTENNYKMGFAGTLAKMFIKSKLTLVIAIASILLGIMAVYMTPKEEEPLYNQKIVTIGGGTGHFTLLRGLVKYNNPK